MSKIRILPDTVANQIAAGEVVERPVAVVKELVENSLDAGANRIQIEFRQGGKSLIRIEDNGYGMEPEDALLCLERHATSKLKEAVDLQTIGTFGFRGEALPSISSVSRFTLRTRSQSWDHGTEILINGGKQVQVKEVGMSVGTTIEVAQLFNSVPARRKFLKTDRTEASHITQLCKLLAVAHPEVSFTLIEDGRTLFRSPVCSTLRDRVSEIFGRQASNNLISLKARESLSQKPIRVEECNEDFSLSGLIIKPGLGNSTRQHIHFFVNRRPIDSRLLNMALIEVYQTYLPSGRYPSAFLFLEMDPQTVDVNVHPAKREVRFRDEHKLRRFVMETLLARLEAEARSERDKALNVFSEQDSGVCVNPLDQQTQPIQATPSPSLRPSVRPQPVQQRAESNEVLEANRKNLEKNEAKAKSKAEELLRERGILPAKNIPKVVEKEGINLDDQKREINWRFVGLMHRKYAYYETPTGVICLNIKAANSRILYEDYIEKLDAGKLAQQQLLFPLEIEFTALNAEMLLKNIPFFEDNGFTIQHKKSELFELSSVPDWFEPSQAETFLLDLVAILHEKGIVPSENKSLAREELARKATQSGARDPVTEDSRSMKLLAEKLLACKNPLADPYGNPSYFESSLNELNRRFAKK